VYPFVTVVDVRSGFVIVTLTAPALADGGATTYMYVHEYSVTDVAAVPPKLTDAIPIKFLPFMVTCSPAFTATGVKD